MRVNIYAEEITNRVQIIKKEIDEHEFTGIRFYLELPATVDGKQYRGPFMHHPGDDDSSAVTFWGKKDFRHVLTLASAALDLHYGQKSYGFGTSLITAERHRQIDIEGYSPESDAGYQAKELERAAMNYVHLAESDDKLRDYIRKNPTASYWPWDLNTFKPGADNSNESKIRELVKAGALIAAAIDRLKNES